MARVSPSRVGVVAVLAAVAAIVSVAMPAALAATAGTAAIDVAIGRDGSRDTGTLQSCVGATCRFDGTNLARAELAWLGLGVPSSAEPPAVGGSGEAAVLADGSVVAGAIEGVSLGVVVIGGRSLDRSDVRWLRFTAAGAARDRGADAAATERPPEDSDTVGGDDRDEDGGHNDDDGDQGDADDGSRDDDGGGGGEVDDDGDRDGRRDDPPPTPPGDTEGDGDRHDPPPRPPNDAPVTRCPADRPLGGEIDYRYRYDDREYASCTGTARLWFRLHPVGSEWPHALSGVWHSDAVTYRLVNEGCTDLPGQPVCSAPQQPEVRGRVVFGPVGRFGVDLRGAPGGPVTFIPFEPQLAMDTLPDEIRHRVSTPLECHDDSGSSSGSWQLPVLGGIFAYPLADCGTNGVTVCVPATRCRHATDPDLQRDCFVHPDRYAVVPFAGSGSSRFRRGGVEQVTSYRWNVCCGCGEPPSGPPPDFEPRPGDDRDPCADGPAQQASYLGQLRAFQEVAARAGQEFGCAGARRDDSFEAIFGASGPLGRWSNALFGLAGEAAPGQVGTLIGILAATISTLQTGSDANFGSLVEVSTGDPATDLFIREATPFLRNAREAALAHLTSHPGDTAGATQLFLRNFRQNAGRVKGGAAFLSALSQLNDFKEASRDVCTALGRWGSWADEYDRIERELGEAQMRVREFTEKLAAIRTRCPELPEVELPPPPALPPRPCPEGPPEDDGEPCSIAILDSLAAAVSPGASAARAAPSTSQLVRVAFRPAPGGAAAANAAAGHAVSSGTGGSDALAELMTLLAGVDSRLEVEIVPCLALFALGEAHDLPPAFAAALLDHARRQLETLQGEIARAVTLGREIERRVERVHPPA